MDIDEKTEDIIKAQIIYMIRYLCNEYNLETKKTLYNLTDCIYAFFKRRE